MSEENDNKVRQGRITKTMPIILGVSLLLAIIALGFVMGLF